MSSRSALQRLRFYTEHPRSIADVPTLADQIAIAEAVRRHELSELRMTPEERARKHNVRWWKAGVGTVTPGEWVESPAVRMARDR